MSRPGNTKTLTVSLQPEQIDQLTELTETMGMYASEIVQTMVAKLYKDPVEQEILMQNYIQEQGEKCSKKRLLRIMSIKKMRKKLAAQRASSGDRVRGGRSISQLEDNIHQQWWKEYCVETIKEGRIPTREMFELWKINNAAQLGMDAAAELQGVL